MSLASEPPAPLSTVRSPAVEELPRRPASPLAIPLWRSEDLFCQSREILIEHAGAHYRLRLTHSNKLILTK